MWPVLQRDEVHPSLLKNDTGFAPWQVHPHRVHPHYKISISSSPLSFSVRVYIVVIKLLNVFEEPLQSMYV